MKSNLIAAVLAISAPDSAVAELQPLWLACGPAEFHEALRPLAEHRRGQGLEVAISSATKPAEAIAACGRSPAYLLIVGDTARGGQSGESWEMPSRAGSLYRWRAVQPETFAADPLWGDLDGDAIPDLPVGRIPARRADDVRKIVSKTITFEARPLSPANLGVPVWGGTPDLGLLVDELATTGFQALVRNHGPEWAEPWMIFGNPRSSLFGDGKAQPDTFNRRLARGGFLSAMVGHGAANLFFSGTDGGVEFSYHTGHAAGLDLISPSPPHIILACDCGSFAGRTPSLAEAMLFAKGGPVNVVAATTESHPLPNYYSSLAVLRALDGGHSRFGDLWHACQLEAFGARDAVIETLLKNAEGALEAEIDIAKLKRDQLLMYALLGDPATKLPGLKDLAVEIDPAGAEHRWSTVKPHGATELHVQIRRPSSPPRAIPAGAAPQEATRLFEARNAAWVFETLAVLDSEAPWRGSVEGPGRLRFVAVSPGSLSVVARDLPN